VYNCSRKVGGDYLRLATIEPAAPPLGNRQKLSLIESGAQQGLLRPGGPEKIAGKKFFYRPKAPLIH